MEQQFNGNYDAKVQVEDGVWTWRQIAEIAGNVSAADREAIVAELGPRLCANPITQEEKERAKRPPYKPELSVDGSGIYILKAANGLFKIGKTRDVKRRMGDYATLIPAELLNLYAFLPTDDLSLEGFLHHSYSYKRVMREWFALSAAEVEGILSRHNSVAINLPLNEFLSVR